MLLGVSQQTNAYTLTNKDLQAVQQIEEVIGQANYRAASQPFQVPFRDEYRTLFNQQTSERRKRVLLEVYIHKDSYLVERKIDNFIDHVHLPSLQLLSEDYRQDKQHIYYIGYRQEGEVFNY
jgi:hypothetical protein